MSYIDSLLLSHLWNYHGVWVVAQTILWLKASIYPMNDIRWMKAMEVSYLTATNIFWTFDTKLHSRTLHWHGNSDSAVCCCVFSFHVIRLVHGGELLGWNIFCWIIDWGFEDNQSLIYQKCVMLHMIQWFQKHKIQHMYQSSQEMIDYDFPKARICQCCTNFGLLFHFKRPML